MGISIQDQIQRAGADLLTNMLTLIKIGVHNELRDTVWTQPIEKFSGALGILLGIERQPVTLLLTRRVAQINTHALWLDISLQAQVAELVEMLSTRNAGGLRIEAGIDGGTLRRFFTILACFSERQEAPRAALNFALVASEITGISLVAGPIRHENLDPTLRGALAIWVYAKAAAGLDLVMSETPVRASIVRRLAQELVDASAVESDILVGLALRSRSSLPVRRAVDVASLVAAVAHRLGLPPEKSADFTLIALMHRCGHAWPNPDPLIFSAAESAGVLAIRQVIDVGVLTPLVARRALIGISHQLGADLQGPPFLTGPPALEVLGQLVVAINLFLDRIHETGSVIRAVIALRNAPPSQVGSSLIEALLTTVGTLPVGTMVQLSNGDLGVVSKVVDGAARQTFVHRFWSVEGEEILEDSAQIELGEDWQVKRTLAQDGFETLIVRGVIRRPISTLIQMGVR